MDLKERQGFAQEEFVALDVHETEECEQEGWLKRRLRILGQTTSKRDATVVFK
jgi:hypothetical protein